MQKSKTSRQGSNHYEILLPFSKFADYVENLFRLASQALLGQLFELAEKERSFLEQLIIEMETEEHGY